ncbi:unnamed protein product, partial [Lymnaea stagnalis]
IGVVDSTVTVVTPLSKPNRQHFVVVVVVLDVKFNAAISLRLPPSGQRICSTMLCCKTPETSKTQDEMILEGKEIKTTLVISLAFQLVFTAFNALQNLHSSLHDEHSLGLICLSTIYFTAIVSSIFSPTIIGLMG